jgi:GcrA cell cycle regulator
MLDVLTKPKPKRWTLEEIEQVRDLASEGLSSGQIADKCGVTRNSIIGLCKRNSIQLLGYGPLRKQTNRPKAEKRPRVQKYFQGWYWPTPRPVAATPPPLPPEPAGPGKPFIELAQHECHWPLGAQLVRSELWCGEPTEPNTPYCQHHYLRAYQKPGCDIMHLMTSPWVRS